MPKGHGEGSKKTQWRPGQSGNPKGTFVPGQSGNPGGRPKGFAARIKELCGTDYDKLAKALYLIGFGSAEERQAFFGEAVDVKTKDRIAAVIALRDSGPGRPMASVVTDDGDTVTVPESVQFVFRKAEDAARQD